MEIVREPISVPPEAETPLDFDCLWLVLSAKRKTDPLASPFLRWLDWRALGRLTEVLDRGPLPKDPTFLPLLPTPQGGLGSQLPVPWLALERGDALDWDRCVRNCAGQQWERVLFFFEDGPSAATSAESAWKKHSSKPFPRRVFLGMDPP